MDRRWFLLSGLALAGCQTTTGNMADTTTLTDAFDGRYEVYVARVANDTPSRRSDPNVPVGQERELATLTLEFVGGVGRLVSLDEQNQGPNYSDLVASFSASGVLRFEATANYLISARKVAVLSFDAAIGPQLISGQTVTITAGNWEPDFAQLVRVRRL